MSEGVNATVLTLEPERIFCEKGEPIVCTGRMTLHVPDALMAWCRGTDVTVYPGHEERLTREEWAKLLADTLEEKGEELGCGVGLWLRVTCPRGDNEFRAQIGVLTPGTEYAYGPDPIAALTALAAAAKPKPCPCKSAKFDGGFWRWTSRGSGIVYIRPIGLCPDCGEQLPPAPLKDPEDMSAEECEAELKAAEAVWICFRNYNMWQCHVVVGNERLEQTVDVDWRTKERALRAAVRALRKYQAAQSRT